MTIANEEGRIEMITIEHINEEAMKKLINECSVRVFNHCEQMEEGLFTCGLNENAILKVFSEDSGIMVDLGGNKCFIDQNDFFTIIIE